MLTAERREGSRGWAAGAGAAGAWMGGRLGGEKKVRSGWEVGAGWRSRRS